MLRFIIKNAPDSRHWYNARSRTRIDVDNGLGKCIIHDSGGDGDISLYFSHNWYKPSNMYMEYIPSSKLFILLGVGECKKYYEK